VKYWHKIYSPRTNKRRKLKTARSAVRLDVRPVNRPLNSSQRGAVGPNWALFETKDVKRPRILLGCGARIAARARSGLLLQLECRALLLCVCMLVSTVALQKRLNQCRLTCGLVWAKKHAAAPEEAALLRETVLDMAGGQYTQSDSHGGSMQPCDNFFYLFYSRIQGFSRHLRRDFSHKTYNSPTRLANCVI